MQVIKEQINEVSASIEVKLHKNDYESEVLKALKEYQRKAVVPGFRQGKAPFGMLKKMYGNTVLAEQVNKLVSDALNNYIIDNNIKVMGYPMSDAQRTGTIDFDNGEEFSFYFNVALAPDFELGLENMQLAYPRVKVNAAEVQETVDKLLADYPEITYPETIETGDEVELRIHQTDANGNELDEGLHSSVRISTNDIADEESKALLLGKELGAEFIFNFRKALGDDEKVIRTLKLKGDENDLIESDYNVVVDEVFRTQAASLNADFFGRIFPGETVDSEEAFREKVKDVMEKQWDAQADYMVYSIALKRLIDETPMRFDQEIMKQWLHENSEGQLKKDDIEANYNSYERSMKYQLIEDRLVETYPELVVSKQEMRNFVASYFFKQYGLEASEETEKLIGSTIDSILKDKKESDRIQRQLREEKMVRLFRSKLSLTDEELSVDAFKAMIEKENKKSEEE